MVYALPLLTALARAAELHPEPVQDLPWSELGYLPNVRTAADARPELLAVGMNDAYAVWDPVNGRVLTDGGAFDATGVDALGLCTNGDVLVAHGVTLSRRSPTGDPRDDLTLRASLPRGAALIVQGDTVLRLTADGLEPVAVADVGGLRTWLGAADSPPEATVRRLARNSGGSTLQVNGRDVVDTAGYASGRVFGSWLLVEERSLEDLGGAAPGTRRTVVSLTTGDRTAPIPTQDWLYRPGLTLGPDGSLAWLAPTPGGLQIWRLRPEAPRSTE